MQALATYIPEKHPEVQAALQALEEPARGPTAKTYLTPRGWFANFVWPDRPPELSNELARKVQDLSRRYPELRPIEQDSAEWNSVFHGWRSDPVSAEVIWKAFHKNFGDRLLWVESERDLRGRIAATLTIKNLVSESSFPPDHPPRSITSLGSLERFEEVSLYLSWKDSQAGPLHEPASEADRKAFSASTQEVFDWAARRIRPILDSLHDKLKQLYGERFRGLYVFGSYARPDAGIELPEDSDLDVAVLLTDVESPYKEIQRTSEITSDLSLEHGILVSLVHIRESDFQEGRTNFTRVISEYAIPVE